MQEHDTWGADEISALRERAGLTVEQFAHRIGISSTTVVRWLNGSSHPSPLAAEKLDALAKEAT